MGMAGLWYFNRGRQLRQNFLESEFKLSNALVSRGGRTLVRSARHGYRMQSPYVSSLPRAVILLLQVQILLQATVGWVNWTHCWSRTGECLPSME